MGLTIDDVNRQTADAFLDAFGGVFEYSPWIAERAWKEHPFKDVEALLAAMVKAVEHASEAERLALIKSHPELAGKAARIGDLTDHSKQEQSSAGLDRLTDAEYDRFHALNKAYDDRFGFPFIIAVRDNDKHSILAAFETRLENDQAQEIETALRNVMRIAELRLLDMVSEKA